MPIQREDGWTRAVDSSIRRYEQNMKKYGRPERPAASTQLAYLRGLPKQMVSRQREYAKQRAKLANDEYMAPAVKAQKLHALAEAASTQLAETQITVKEYVAAIKKKVVNGIEVTDSARAQLRDALSAGMNWLQIARFYTDHQNRGGLAALRERLDLEQHAGTADEKQMPAMLAAISEMERSIMTPEEQTALDEAAEVDNCIQYLQGNLQKVTAHIESQNPFQPGIGIEVTELYGWVGLDAANRVDPFKLPIAEEVQA